jgi:hypothetical protein
MAPVGLGPNIGKSSGAPRLVVYPESSISLGTSGRRMGGKLVSDDLLAHFAVADVDPAYPPWTTETRDPWTGGAEACHAGAPGVDEGRFEFRIQQAKRSVLSNFGLALACLN